MSRPLLIVGFVVAISSAIPAQSPEPPLADTRLTVHTLVREDIFAGFLQNDLSRTGARRKEPRDTLRSPPGRACRHSRLAGQHGADARGAGQRGQAA
jgi:hypothetical protein